MDNNAQAYDSDSSAELEELSSKPALVDLLLALKKRDPDSCAWTIKPEDYDSEYSEDPVEWSPIHYVTSNGALAPESSLVYMLEDLGYISDDPETTIDDVNEN